MGIVVVLLFYAAAMMIAASIAAAVLGAVSYFLTKDYGSKKWRRAVVASVLFPYLCVAFAGGGFVTYWIVNENVFHRDPMLGDTWETPLPNGYALMMIDTTDHGTVYNPKTQSDTGLVFSSKDSAFGVRQLQVADKFILGARDEGYSAKIGQNSRFVDTFFEIDTVKNTQKEFKSIDDLRRQAATDGVRLNLREFQTVFSEYRTTWFDYLAGIILLIVPMSGFLVLFRRVWRLRAQPDSPAEHGSVF
jgi:hypothetical protein